MLLPFGDPDGSRAPLDERSNEFVRLDQRFGAIGQSVEDFLRTRVIVGGQGTGKTVFLRRLHQHYLEEPSVNALPPVLETSELDTETVIRFSQLFPQTTNSEKWSAIWRRAIELAAAEALLVDAERAHGSVSDTQMDALEGAVIRLGFPRVTDPVELAAYICRTVQGASAFETQVQHNDDWTVLARGFEGVLGSSREQYLFIDAIDDNYHYAPAYWMACQRGLFYAVMQLMRRQATAHKLHAIITVRDLVMSSVYRSEHGARYATDAAIADLTWSWKAASEFLRSKVGALPRSLFRNPDAGDGLEEFMGRREIFNAARERNEPIEQYLLRHSRLCPRDLIVLGNDLVALADSHGILVADLTDEQIRQSVSSTSALFAHWNLAQAANQILTNIMPWNASRHDFARVYLSENEYSAETVVREICSVLMTCGAEVFPNTALDAAEQEAGRRFGSGSYFADVMWQNRVIGVVDDQDRPVFYRMWRGQLGQIPVSEKYVVNPLFIEKLPGLLLNDGIRLNHKDLP